MLTTVVEMVGKQVENVDREVGPSVMHIFIDVDDSCWICLGILWDSL